MNGDLKMQEGMNANKRRIKDNVHISKKDDAIPGVSSWTAANNRMRRVHIRPGAVLGIKNQSHKNSRVKNSIFILVRNPAWQIMKLVDAHHESRF